MASNNNLNDAFNDIATAINNKGVSGTMMPTEMADKIAEIPSGSTGEIVSCRSSGYTYIVVDDHSCLKCGSSYAHFDMCDANFNGFVFNPANMTKSIRVIIRAKPTNMSQHPFLFGCTSWQAGLSWGGDPTNIPVVVYRKANGNRGYMSFSAVTLNNWYYFVLYYSVSEGILFASIYDDNLNLIQTKFATTDLYSYSGSYRLGGETQSDNMYIGYIDFQSSCFVMDDVEKWGTLNSKTQNLGIPTS